MEESVSGREGSGQGGGVHKVIITRGGKAAAHLPPATGPRKPQPLGDLAEFRASMPALRRPAAELLREARDKGL